MNKPWIGILLIAMAASSPASVLDIAGGRMDVAGALAADGVTVGAEATLAGGGSVHGPVAVSGTLAPAGTLSFGDTVFFSGGVLLSHASDNTTLDGIAAVGAITGAATVRMTRAETAFPTQQVVAAGSAGSDYSLFVVIPSSNWVAGESGALNLWVTYAQAPVVGPVTLWRATNQVLKVADLMLLTNSVDPQGSAMTVVWVSPASTNGGSVSLSGRWTTYVPPAGDDSPDYFTFRVQNAIGGWNEAQAEVLLLPPGDDDGPSQNLANITPSGPDILVRFIGIPGRSYDVQATTNLVDPDWTNIGSCQIGAQGYVVFTDVNPPGSRYYRTARQE